MAKAKKVEKEEINKFVELARMRVPKALKAIRGISKLSAKRYNYTDEQVAKIRAALEGEVERCLEAFEKGAPVKEEFDI